MKAIRAIGFDLDNTLFDHRAAATSGLELFMSEKGWNCVGVESIGQAWHRLEDLYFAQYVAGTMTLMEHRRARMHNFLAETDAVGDHDLDALWDDYLRHYSNSWIAYSDVAPVLGDLLASGYKLGVVTNGQQAQQEAKLTAMGLSHFFEVVLAIGSLEALKPDRRAFDQLTRTFGCEADEIIFVGDDLDYDVRPSISAGLRGVWLNRNEMKSVEGSHDEIESLHNLKGLL